MDVNLTGQDELIKDFLNNLKSDRLHHAYIFSGDDGVGKEEIVELIAKSILCYNPSNGPCGKCQSCIKFDIELPDGISCLNIIEEEDEPDKEEKIQKGKPSGKPCGECEVCRRRLLEMHPDLYIIDFLKGKKQIVMEQVRQIYDYVKYPPILSKYKVCIIKETDTFTGPTSNAILKLLEEPPENFIFLLISSNYRTLLPTIISRCHIIKIKNLEQKKIQQILSKQLGIKEEESKFLSVISNGRIKKAVSYCSTPVLEERHLLLTELTDALLERKFLKLYSFTDQLTERKTYTDLKMTKRKYISEVLDFIIYLLRDVIIYKTTSSDSLIMNIDFINEIKKITELYSNELLYAFLNNAARVKLRIDRNLDMNLQLDTIFLN